VKDQFLEFAPLFTGLSEEERAALSEHFMPAQLSAGSALFKAGDPSDGVYLLGKGFVRLFTGGGHNIATSGPGSVLGEDSLFRSLPYDVGANAVADLEYWKLPDARLREIIMRQPAIGLKLSQNFGSLIAQMQDYLVQQLARTPEMNGLPRNTLQAVAERLQPRRLSSGQYLYRAGEGANGLFLVETGQIDVQNEGMSEQTVAANGALLGALAMITGKPQPGSAVAGEDTLVWALAPDDFQTVASRHGGLRRSLARTLRSRLGRNDQAAAIMRLSKLTLFADLSNQAVQSIAGRMVLQHIPAGERVYRMGETGDALYFVESGEVELTAENANGVVEEMARIGSDGAFGEMSLLTGQIRTEDATATRNTNLWILFKNELEALAAQNPTIGKALSAAMATRLASAGAVDADHFRNFALLADLSPADLRQISAHLRPTRYRAGETIFRANTPPEKLFLLEAGSVRIQSLAGAVWSLQPGDAFGERALLTNSMHVTTAVAETDVDLWTVGKQEFEMLMNRHPGLAVSMSRLLSQRMSPPEPVATYGMPGSMPGGAPAGAPPPNLPLGGAVPPAGSLPASASRRRNQAAAGPEAMPGKTRRGWGESFANLSAPAKLQIGLLVLLLVIFLCITVPLTVMQVLDNMRGSNAGADNSGLLTGLSAVRAMGSFEVASANAALAKELSAADAAIPPTPTYTPFPTNTPLPTMTPLPTNTPAPVATSTPQPVAEQIFYAEAAPVEEATATPAPVVAAAAVARALDSRLGGLGVSIEDAAVAPGQPYYFLKEVRWEDEQEAGGKHHIYVDVLDENGRRIVGQNVTVFWSDGSATLPLEDKPFPDFGFNYQMYASGYAYSVKVEGLPSDILRGAGMGDLANRFKGIHTAYYLTYQKAIK
jgi:CRP-like cAMP-binding protein